MAAVAVAGIESTTDGGLHSQADGSPSANGFDIQNTEKQEKAFGDFWHNTATFSNHGQIHGDDSSPHSWGMRHCPHSPESQSGLGPAWGRNSSIASAGSAEDQAGATNRAVSRARAAAFLQENRCAIHPEKTVGYLYFKGILALALLCTLIVTPYEVAFLTQDSAFEQFFVLHRILDAIHLIDFVLCFHLMYCLETSRSVIWVSSRCMLVTHYLKTWCLSDCLGIIPFDIIAYVVYPNHDRQARILRICRLLKVCRGIRERENISIDRAVSRFMHVPPHVTQVLKFVTAMLLVGHWVGCMFGFLAIIQDDVAFSRGSWILAEYEKGHSSPTDLWLAATYWGVMTLTSVGYGDVVPVSSLERVGAVVLMVISGCIWAALLSEFTANAAARGQRNRKFHAMMIEVDDVMRQARCPKELILDVQRYFRIKQQNGDTYFRLRSLMKDMTHGLQVSIMKATNRDWLVSVRYLLDCSSELRTEVCSKLQQRMYTRGEKFGQVWHLYVVKNGMVARMGPFLRILSKSCVWGEDIILNDISLLENLDVLSLIFSEVLILGKAGLVDALRQLPSDSTRIRKYAARMALQRGLLQLAYQKRPDIRCLQLRYETFVQPRKLERLPSYMVQSGINRKSSFSSGRGTPPNGFEVFQRPSFSLKPPPIKPFSADENDSNRVTFASDEGEAGCSGLQDAPPFAGGRHKSSHKESRERADISDSQTDDIRKGMKPNINMTSSDTPGTFNKIFQRLDEQNQKVDSLGKSLRDRMELLDQKLDRVCDLVLDATKGSSSGTARVRHEPDSSVTHIPESLGSYFVRPTSLESMTPGLPLGSLPEAKVPPEMEKTMQQNANVKVTGTRGCGVCR